MLLPFVKTNGATTDKIKDYDFKNHYPDVNMNTEWVQILPYCRQAIRSYVLPYVGKTLYDDICTKLQNGDTLTTTQTDFAELLKDVCAHYTILTMLPKKKTIISSMGAVENVATEGTTSVTLWGFKTTLFSVMQDADKMMDELLSFIADEVEIDNAYFVTNWKETSAFTSVSSGFFRQTLELQAFHPINRSFRIFKALVPVLDECEERYIKPILCSDQYTALLDAISENDASADETVLIKKVRKTLAKWAIYEACASMPVISDQEGFRIISNADAIDQKQYGDAIIQGAIQGIRQSAEQSARIATADLINYLYTNKDSFPLWRDSDCNKANTQVSSYPIFQADDGAIML